MEDSVIRLQVRIYASREAIWQFLTDFELIKKWMQDESITVEIKTNWIPGSSIFMSGILHGHTFENKGIVNRLEPPKRLVYSHLSSLSKLSDDPENYSILDFEITPDKEYCTLHLSISNFPTPEIRHHLRFYWQGTLQLIKQLVESA